jgi:hypothetical protein
VIDDYRDMLTWTPSANHANTDVHFEIATERDFCGDRAKQSWTIHVYESPVIQSFTAERNPIGTGESTSLIAVFQGSGQIEGLGPITSGVPASTPVLNTSTNFTLIVTNIVGEEVTQTVTIEVLEPPVIQSLSASPAIVTVGDMSTLIWSVTGDFSVARLDPLGVDVTPYSSFEVTPAATTIYVLHLSNEVGASTSQSVQVEVVPPPVIESFTATPSSTVLRGSVLLSGEFQNGSGEIEMEDIGMWISLGPVVAGEAVDSGELLRSTRFRLVVRNEANTEAMQYLLVPITGPRTFQPTSGQPIYPLRGEHSATRLADGLVFVAGGRIGSVASSTTEIFDPVTETFTAGPNLIEARFDHAAALLPDGRVLLVGGYRSDTTRMLSAEIYDPSSDTVTSAGLVPASDLVLPQAAELLDGRVLVVHSSLGQGAEVFDPLTDTFTPVGPFNEVHACIRAERLDDGRVLVIDGYTTNPSEIFSPGPDSFALTDAVTHNRCYFASAALQDGRILLTGGSSTIVAAEIYDPATGSFADVGTPQYSASGPTASTLISGEVLVVSGLTAELFDPLTDTFAVTGGLRDAHRFHSATLLQDGRVLIIGGCRMLPCDAELYTPP